MRHLSDFLLHNLFHLCLERDLLSVDLEHEVRKHEHVVVVRGYEQRLLGELQQLLPAVHPEMADEDGLDPDLEVEPIYGQVATKQLEIYVSVRCREDKRLALLGAGVAQHRVCQAHWHSVLRDHEETVRV